MAQQLPMQVARFMAPGRRMVSKLAAWGAGMGAVLSPVAARAEGAAPQATRSLTMQEALAFARQHQPAIHAALARVSARMAEAQVPSGQWMPTVGVSAQIYGMTANNSTGTYVST